MVPGAGGIRVKSSEAIAGGAAHEGVLGRWLQANTEGFRHSAAINDLLHHRKNPRSLHTHGLAIDASYGSLAQQNAAKQAFIAEARRRGLSMDDLQVISHQP